MAGRIVIENWMSVHVSVSITIDEGCPDSSQWCRLKFTVRMWRPAVLRFLEIKARAVIQFLARIFVGHIGLARIGESIPVGNTSESFSYTPQPYI